jgi:hypothetical protein
VFGDKFATGPGKAKVRQHVTTHVIRLAPGAAATGMAATCLATRTVVLTLCQAAAAPAALLPSFAC